MRRRWGRARAVMLVVAVAATTACSPDRIRPGPPQVMVDLFQGATVSAADTLYMAIFASDPNGLDSVAVQFLGQTQPVFYGGAEVFDVADTIGWIIPSDAAKNQVFWFFGYARDLTGDVTLDSASVTVVTDTISAASLR